MYLSKVTLNGRDRRVWREMADCHELHRTLMSAFPDGLGDEARAACGLLFRPEQDRAGLTPVVLAQSTVLPDWGRLPDGFALRHACKPVDALWQGLTAGRQLRFRLRANPTKRLGTAGERVTDPLAGKRVHLRSEEAQLAWLARKGEGGGFRATRVQASPEVTNVQARPQDTVQGRRRTEGRTDRLTFGAVLFDGELEVTDAGVFRATLAAGVGAGKAYGFGLLSVAPA